MRNRKSMIQATLILLTSLAAVLVVLGFLLKQVPDFYRAQTKGELSDALIGPELLTRFGDLKNDIRSQPEWGATFSSEELNAFFRDALGPEGSLAGILPDGLSEPRVQIAGDKLRIAGRLGDGFWSTVISLEIRAWLVEADVNTIAIELCGMWAGRFPMGTQSVLESISEVARESNMVVTWYRHNGHPVGIVRFYADQARPTTQIRRFKIEDGAFTVAGRSMIDGNPPATP